MSFSITGRLHTIFDTKRVSDRFTKREFVVEVSDGKYAQQILFQVTNDRISNLDRFSVGDDVAIEFNLRGREWKSPSGEVKYFNSCEAWKLDPVVAPKAAQSSNPPPADPRDDLPF
jgi:hypothetical protein